MFVVVVGVGRPVTVFRTPFGFDSSLVGRDVPRVFKTGILSVDGPGDEVSREVREGRGVFCTDLEISVGDTE